MSQFLAPIHTWLFEKIILMEGIEKDLAKFYSDSKYQNAHAELIKKYGEFIPDKPLEELIDQSNIHGWLQERITIGETRQAEFIHFIMENEPKAVEQIALIYQEAGKRAQREMDVHAKEPQEAFRMLGDVLLEGMPCDRVNAVLEQTPEHITWVTSTCVHRNNWETAGVEVSNYYLFREAFTRGFIEALNPEMSYSYTNEEQQLHEIKKSI